MPPASALSLRTVVPSRSSVPGTSLLARVLTVAMVAAAVLVASPPTGAEAVTDATAETDFVTSINAERRSRGIAPLTVCAELRKVARQHSVRMSGQDHLHHNPNLGTDVKGWQRLAENVGVGPNASRLHQAFMDSDGHRRNILDSRVTQVGVGVDVVGGRMWVTEVFRLPTSGAACTAVTAPAPTVQAVAPKTEPVTRLAGDFRGNGREQIVTYDPADGALKVIEVTATGSVTRTWAKFSTRTGWEHFVADVDGDGRDDVVSYHAGAGSWWVSQSTGSSFVGSRWAKFSTRTGWEHLVADVDGDGRDDLVSYHAGAGSWWLSQSTGSTFAGLRL